MKSTNLVVKDLLKNVEVLVSKGELPFEVNEIQVDSRKVGKGDCFVAIEGTGADGHQFIKNAVDQGAAMIVFEKPTKDCGEVPRIRVNNSRQAWSQMCCNRFDNPSEVLELVGVTGTNGKTTTVTLLYKLFHGLGYQVGLISTNGNRVGEEEVKASHTTPDPFEVNDLLAKMVDRGCKFAFMEVSSHALDQDRVHGLHFRGAIFTNLSHDHLDYHKDFKSYLKAKKKLFDNLEDQSFGLVNADDKNGKVMLQNCGGDKFTFGIQREATYRGKIIESSVEGLQLEIDRFSAHFLLAGDYNASNIMAVYGAGRQLGVSSVELLTVLSRIKPPEGRFEKVHQKKDLPSVIVDYAHTPDALKKILSTLVKMRRKGQKIIVVFGCGGDRDRTKRPEMGKIASRLADEVVITSDNPRTEDPSKIMDDIEEGVSLENRHKIRRVEKRADGIHVGCKIAGKNDVVLVAGKGHEKYQEIHGKKFPFDDKEIIREALGLTD